MGLTGRAILNIEGAGALAWLLILFFRSGGKPFTLTERSRWLWLLVLIPLPFLPFLSSSFLADDYPHILHARALTFSAIPSLFTLPAADHFFRPAGYLLYALEAHWAGLSPALWRSGGLLIHVANAVLVYLLCRTLAIPFPSALFAALLFGVHGSRPEAVHWVAARFDLLAVFFSLLCLILLLRRHALAACLALFAAVISKESAFVVPLLAVAVLWYSRVSWQRLARRALPLFAVAGTVFVYRWILLGGVGGYRNLANGSPTIFDFNVPTTVQALFPRLWAALLFPINWTTRPGVFLSLSLAASALSLLWLAAAKPSRRTFVFGLIFIYLCAIPVHQFLSIGPDLEKSRVLYFASAGFAILLGSTLTSRMFLMPAALVLVFQVAALEHNLQIWKEVGNQARAACQPGAFDLPNVVNGVYFLHTGFPECLEFR